MKLSAILDKYDTSLLDQISADKVDETISLRLPQSVIIQEIASALGSLSYVANKITYARPPAFAIMDLLLNAPSHMLEVEGFREKVLTYIQELSEKAGNSRAVFHQKNPDLYVKIMRRAWESDGMIDKSEGHILEVVKTELGIWDREHFLLMHHPSILKMWDIDQEYFNARNLLLTSGIVLTNENKYLIAEEVAAQVRRAFGIDIMDDAYARLLNTFKREELSQLSIHVGLSSAGSKDDIIDRLINSLMPPFELLNVFTIDALRDCCRHNNIQISGAKNMVINNIIRFFDQGHDLLLPEAEEPEPLLPAEPEVREMDKEIFTKVLLNLTHQQLYDTLQQSHLALSGSKEEKVQRLVNSPWSERSILNRLRKEDLAQICRRFNLQVSGSKQELVDRVLDINPTETVPEVVVQLPAEEIAATAVERKEVVSDARPAETATLPSNFEEIDRKFSELDKDEKIVLAVVKEARSLTEQELERVVARHQLHWFLHKAHMAEIIAKLKRTKKEPIRIKSIQHTNIYQWVDEDGQNAQVMEKRSARDIIDALRHGVVPKSNLDLLMVGQENARKHLAGILGELDHHKSHFKFIRGQYGSGKTFLCSWLKEHALANEYAVSFLNISHDQPLSDLPVFFSGMIQGLRTPEKTDSSALIDILESWLLNIHKRTAQIEGISFEDAGSLARLTSIVEKSIETELANLNDIEPGFSQAIRAFYKGRFENNQMLVSNAIAWITGSRSLSTQALREIGVKGVLEANNVFPRMRAILEIISGARYKGLLLLVDELELVRKFPHARQREQALETLRLLIDEAGRNALPGCLVIFTGTDEFFEDERFGLKSYEALAERVLSRFQHEGFVSMRQPIISLESLDKQRLSNVIFKIRDLYGQAYSWDANQFADEESIGKLIDSWTIFGDESIDRKPRPILREFIQMLDLCEENRGLSIAEFLKKREFGDIGAN